MFQGLIFVSFLAGSACANIASPFRSNVGTFHDPGALRRPKFRYWLPDASVSGEEVATDIESALNVGMGGIEFLPFYEYGGELGPPPAGIDWAKYGFGTLPFKGVLRSALEAHAQKGGLMDFALGPGQGQGVPSNPDAVGLQWDLVSAVSSQIHMVS